MIFVITGNGKGKTTSALGMVSRALGHGKKCAVVQFLKHNPKECGEYSTYTKLGVEWFNFGCGFTWQQESLEPTKKLCEEGWNKVRELVAQNRYYLIVLDEFTYVLENEFLNTDDVISFLKRNNHNADLNNIVITGRRANSELIDVADTVSEINEIKHHFNENGNKTVKALDF